MRAPALLTPSPAESRVSRAWRATSSVRRVCLTASAVIVSHLLASPSPRGGGVLRPGPHFGSRCASPFDVQVRPALYQHIVRVRQPLQQDVQPQGQSRPPALRANVCSNPKHAVASLLTRTRVRAVKSRWCARSRPRNRNSSLAAIGLSTRCTRRCLKTDFPEKCTHKLAVSCATGRLASSRLTRASRRAGDAALAEFNENGALPSRAITRQSSHLTRPCLACRKL